MSPTLIRRDQTPLLFSPLLQVMSAILAFMLTLREVTQVSWASNLTLARPGVRGCHLISIFGDDGDVV